VAAPRQAAHYLYGLYEAAKAVHILYALHHLAGAEASQLVFIGKASYAGRIGDDVVGVKRRAGCQAQTVISLYRGRK